MAIIIEYTVKQPAKSILDTDFSKIIDEILDEGSKGIVKGITDGIRRKRQPDGRRQKENSTEWKEEKAEQRVKPNIPLHHEGLFISRKTYKIKKTKNARNITVKAVSATLPGGGKDTNRKKVAVFVQKKGYKFIGITKPANKLIDLIIKRSINKHMKVKNLPRVTIRVTR